MPSAHNGAPPWYDRGSSLKSLSFGCVHATVAATSARILTVDSTEGEATSASSPPSSAHVCCVSGDSFQNIRLYFMPGESSSNLNRDEPLTSWVLLTRIYLRPLWARFSVAKFISRIFPEHVSLLMKPLCVSPPGPLISLRHPP